MSAPSLSEHTPLDVVDAMRRRRMHRVFADRAVPSEVLRSLAWGATRAQQARPGVRHLVIVDDPGLMAAARELLPGFINNAPAMIVLCTDLIKADEVMGRRGVEHATRLDAGAACAHLGLLAPAFGLGICVITSWAEPLLAELVGLPPHLRPDASVAVGYLPPSPPAAPRGFAFDAWHNRYGAALAVGST